MLYQSVPYIEVQYKSNRNDTLTHHHDFEGADPLDRERAPGPATKLKQLT